MTWTTRRVPPRAVSWAAVACVLAWAVPAALLEGTARAVATTSALSLTALLAAVACAVRAVGARGRARWAWSLLSAAAGTWATAEAAWGVSGVARGTVAVPGAVDPLFLLSAALLLGGIALLTLPRVPVTARLLVALDGAIVATSALLVTWPWLVAPFASLDPSTATASLVSAAYVGLDVAAIAVGLAVLARTRWRREQAWWHGPLPFLAAAAVCTGAGDLLCSQAALAGTYAFGHPAELPYALRTGLLLAAAAGAGGHREPVAALPGRTVLVAPYAVVLVGVGSVVHRAWVGSVGDATLTTVGMLAVLVIVRQVLTVLEHTELRRELEARVVARTRELADTEQWFRTVLQHSSDVVTAVDAEGCVVWQSGDTGRGGPDLRDRRFLDTLPDGEARARVAAALRESACAPGSVRTVPWTLPGADGERHMETTYTSLLHDPVVGAVVMTTRDVTERTLLQRELSHQALHDGLTGLANRSLFRDRLEHALAARVRDGLPVAVLFLDLDGFKAVNDTLGHASGDVLLREVAARLAAVVRPGDTIARLGGDEFAVLLERVTGDEEAERVARRILQALAAPVTVGGKPLPLTGSLGLAVSQTGTETGEELLRNADLSMYHAKSRGGGEPVRYHPRMHQELMARIQVEEGLRTALAEGQLRLHYQPTVVLDTGLVTGVEALVRWQHPDGHLVPPAEFIGVAEESGLILDIGEWVLREACRQGAEWMHSPSGPVAVSVNVSGRQLVPALVGTVADVLAETGLPPELLVLELTESVLVSDGEATVALLHRLKDLGLRLAIDDFGTGYSSLAYLSRLPVDVIKVDRSFVNDLGAPGERAQLARTIIEMAHTLRLSTTAEGVESGEQLHVLRRLGCDLGQGFLFSAPLTAERVGALLHRTLAGAPAA